MKTIYVLFVVALAYLTLLVDEKPVIENIQSTEEMELFGVRYELYSGIYEIQNPSFSFKEYETVIQLMQLDIAMLKAKITAEQMPGRLQWEYIQSYQNICLKRSFITNSQPLSRVIERNQPLYIAYYTPMIKQNI